MLKFTDNPPILIPGVESLSELEGTWWVAHTKPNSEKVFAWDLKSRGIGYFLPMREYVIFSGSDEDRYRAMATNRLFQVIEMADQVGLVLQLTTIEKGLLCKARLDPYPYRPIGTRTMVISGPMMGAEGVVVERKDAKARMVLEVTMLGQGAVVEIDADLLEPVD